MLRSRPTGATYTNPAPLLRGLVPLSASELDFNEFDQCERTRHFLCFNHLLPRFRPARYAPEPEHPDNLFAITSRFAKNAHARGIGILEVLYRGAFFESDDADATTTPYETSNYVKDTITIGIYRDVTADAATGQWGIVGEAVLEYYAIERQFTYIARTKPSEPLFADLAYVVDTEHPAPKIERVTATNTQNHWNPTGLGPIENPEISQKQIIVSVADVRIVPCGKFFQVEETGQVKYAPTTPTPLATYVET